MSFFDIFFNPISQNDSTSHYTRRLRSISHWNLLLSRFRIFIFLFIRSLQGSRKARKQTLRNSFITGFPAAHRTKITAISTGLHPPSQEPISRTTLPGQILLITPKASPAKRCRSARQKMTNAKSSVWILQKPFLTASFTKASHCHSATG